MARPAVAAPIGPSAGIDISHIRLPMTCIPNGVIGPTACSTSIASSDRAPPASLIVSRIPDAMTSPDSRSTIERRLRWKKVIFRSDSSP